MAILNKLKFSKLAKVNRSSITRAIESRNLEVRADGKLDTLHPVNKDYILRCKAKKVQPEPTSKPVSKAEPTQTDDPGADITEFTDGIDDKSLNALCKSSIDKVKVIEQVKKIRVDTKKERMELVDRTLVERVFSKLYMIDVNFWRTLGANLSPEIAAIAKIDDNETIIKVGEVIEKEVFVVLQHVKRTMNDFLVGIDAEEIE